MLYTTIVCFLCILISSYILTLEAYELKYNVSIKKQVLSKKKYIDMRETMITKLNKYILENISYSNEEHIYNHFENLDPWHISLGDNYNIEFNKSNNTFIFVMLEGHINYSEIYKIKLDDKKAIKYIRIKFEYINK